MRVDKESILPGVDIPTKFVRLSAMKAGGFETYDAMRDAPR